jgi:hypothetical protein
MNTNIRSSNRSNNFNYSVELFIIRSLLGWFKATFEQSRQLILLRAEFGLYGFQDLRFEENGNKLSKFMQIM